MVCSVVDRKIQVFEVAMKVVFIIPYFGRFPNYFQLFLNSCKMNQSFDWMLFTDNNEPYHYPDNVHIVHMTFDECKKLIQSKFDFKISLNTYNKLCDFKPVYGYVFQDYIGKYDFWGHCDIDQIFGNLSDFYTNEMFDKYDKIGSLGHLTLYRNNEKVNTIFRGLLNGKERFKEVFTTDHGVAFDEWLSGNINEIFLNSDCQLLLDNYGADIYPYKTAFSLIHFNVEERKYVFDDVKNSIFKWDHGKLSYCYEKDSKAYELPKPYIHLQKRKMKIDIPDNANSYYIIPNSFVDDSKTAKKYLHVSNKWKLFNYQFFKVKYASLKSRIKNRNWNQERIKM